MRRLVDAFKAWIGRMFSHGESRDAKQEFDEFFGS